MQRFNVMIKLKNGEVPKHTYLNTNATDKSGFFHFWLIHRQPKEIPQHMLPRPIDKFQWVEEALIMYGPSYAYEDFIKTVNENDEFKYKNEKTGAEIIIRKAQDLNDYSVI